MTQLNFGRDVQGFNAFAPTQADLLYSATLASGVNSSITIPSSAPKWIIAISYQPGTITYVSVNGTAEAPASGTFATTTSELNPSPRTVYAGDVVDFITTNMTADVGVALYVVP